jgi:hypothetical protein
MRMCMLPQRHPQVLLQSVHLAATYTVQHVSNEIALGVIVRCRLATNDNCTCNLARGDLRCCCVAPMVEQDAHSHTAFAAYSTCRSFPNISATSSSIRKWQTLTAHGQSPHSHMSCSTTGPNTTSIWLAACCTQELLQSITYSRLSPWQGCQCVQDVAQCDQSCSITQVWVPPRKQSRRQKRPPSMPRRAARSASGSKSWMSWQRCWQMQSSHSE